MAGAEHAGMVDPSRCFGSEHRSCQPDCDAGEPSGGWIPNVPAKADMASMELPLFALKSGDKAPRVYVDSRYRVEIIPSAMGAATQRDKDILLFCVSQLIVARDRGRSPMTRRVRAQASEILAFCKRGNSGKDYDRVGEALIRLRGTTIRTDYQTGGKLVTDAFGLIESFRIEREKATGRMRAVEILISDWMFNSVVDANVLTIPAAYFRLSSNLARRVFEVVRKHCGSQSKWEISLKRLMEKCGSRGSFREFERGFEAVVNAGVLPGYRATIDGRREVVVFYSLSPRGHIKSLLDFTQQLDVRPSSGCRASDRGCE